MTIGNVGTCIRLGELSYVGACTRLGEWRYESTMYHVLKSETVATAVVDRIATVDKDVTVEMAVKVDKAVTADRVVKAVTAQREADTTGTNINAETEEYLEMETNVEADAKECLETIETVTRESGISALRSFHRLFLEEFRVTPMEYREKNKIIDNQINNTRSNTKAVQIWHNKVQN